MTRAISKNCTLVRYLDTCPQRGARSAIDQHRYGPSMLSSLFCMIHDEHCLAHREFRLRFLNIINGASTLHFLLHLYVALSHALSARYRVNLG